MARIILALIGASLVHLSTETWPTRAESAGIYTLPFVDTYVITCPWGPYEDCGFPPGSGNHDGTDYSLGGNNTAGEPIAAAAAGTAWLHQQLPIGCGKYVVMDHGSGHRTRYCHLDSWAVIDGQYLARGDLVGYEGESGVDGGGVHLHFDTRINGEAGSNCCSGISVDPYAAGTYMWTVPRDEGDPSHPRPPLWSIKKSVTESNSTEVHVQTWNGWDRWSFEHQKGTALHPTGPGFEFALANWSGDAMPELWAIKKSGTAGMTEVHIQRLFHNGSGVQDDEWRFVHQAPTSIHATGNNWEFSAANFTGDSLPELWGFKKWSSASTFQHPEVHIDRWNGSAWVRVHDKALTDLPEGSPAWDYFPADWDGDGAAEIWAVRRSSSANVRLRILRWDGSAWALVHDRPTALGALPASAWPQFRFTAADWTRGGRPELWAVKKYSTAGTTEVHVQSWTGSSWQWVHQKGTSLGETYSNWEFGVAGLAGSASADAPHNCIGLGEIDFRPTNDEDCDGVTDAAEDACAGAGQRRQYHRRPERIDGAFGGVDDDGDGLIDERLPTGADAYDCDGDGFTGSAEKHVYYSENSENFRGDQDPCGSAPDSGPFHTPLGWPADLKGGIATANKVTLQDLSAFVAPVRRLNTSLGHPNFDQRWDLVPGSAGSADQINLLDISRLSTLAPSMLAGALAFNGPSCPWPP